MAFVDKVKSVKDVLSAIKKHKKIFNVVEEMIILAKMLDVEVLGSVSGRRNDETDIFSSSQTVGVTYELRFYVKRDGRSFEEKIMFNYVEGQLNSVETYSYPFTLDKTSNIRQAHKHLESFKRIFY